MRISCSANSKSDDLRNLFVRIATTLTKVRHICCTSWGIRSFKATDEYMSTQFFHWSAVKLANWLPILRGIRPTEEGTFIDVISCCMIFASSWFSKFFLKSNLVNLFAMPRKRQCIGSIVWCVTGWKYFSSYNALHLTPYSFSSSFLLAGVVEWLWTFRAFSRWFWSVRGGQFSWSKPL